MRISVTGLAPTSFHLINGVNVKDVLDVLQNPARLGDIRKLKNGKSQRFIGDLLTATVNPDTGVLIQVNPTTRRKGFK